MDLADLGIFRAVVEAGGVTKAAERLHRVPSNISTRVRQLERELGVSLFIREGKRLHVSPAGRQLLGYAERLLDLAREALDAVQDTKPRGLFRLGAMPSAAAIRLPRPLNTLHHRYPDISLELRTDTVRALTQGVMRGDLDAAFVAEPVAETPFEKTMIFDEELAIFASARHKPIHRPSDVNPQTMLVLEPGCPYRLRLERWFQETGETPERIIEMTSWHAILGCAAAGMGVAALPRIVLSSFPERKLLRLHPLPRHLSRAPTMLIWRKGMRSPKVNALVEVVSRNKA
jgi:DNA-binding transcriptional LysR family regulator